MTPLDRQSVTTANASFYAAVESADMDLLASLWVEGPGAGEAMCVHPGWPALHGRETILRSFAAILANTPYLQFFLTDVEVQVSGDVAVVTCAENILTGVGAGTTGSGLTGGRVMATNLFRRTAGGWRLWMHHASPVLGADLDDEGDESDPSSGDAAAGDAG